MKGGQKKKVAVSLFICASFDLSTPLRISQIHYLLGTYDDMNTSHILSVVSKFTHTTWAQLLLTNHNSRYKWECYS